MTNLISTLFVVLAWFAGTGVVLAATPLELKSDVFVERQVVRSDGKSAMVLEKPDMVSPGDQLVFVVRYKNVGDATASNLVVTNPLPPAIVFNGTSDGLEIVSTDGGKSWGSLRSLRIALPDGTARTANMADVTHIKWNLNQPLTAGSGGKLIFRGIVK